MKSLATALAHAGTKTTELPDLTILTNSGSHYNDSQSQAERARRFCDLAAQKLLERVEFREPWRSLLYLTELWTEDYEELHRDAKRKWDIFEYLPASPLKLNRDQFDCLTGEWVTKVGLVLECERYHHASVEIYMVRSNQDLEGFPPYTREFWCEIVPKAVPVVVESESAMTLPDLLSTGVAIPGKRLVISDDQIMEYLEQAWRLLFALFLAILCSILCFRPEGLRYRRPKHVVCATMPWSIWPSLVILWGVCWMFYGPSSPLNPGTNLDELIDQISQDEVLFAPQFDFDPAINFDFPAYQLSFDNNEFGQQDPARFRTSFAVTGAAGVLAQESADPVTSVHQLHDKLSSSLLALSASHNTAIDNLPAVTKAPARRNESNASIHCTEPECQSSFGTERELLRHQESIHSGLQFPCAISGCERGSQKPFNRLDNLRRHMRRIHGQASQVHPVAVPESSPRGKKRRADIISQSRPVPENRRRRLEDALVHTDAQGSSQPAIDQSVELARLRRELEDAVADNQSLKEEIRSLKEEIKLRNALDECVRNRLARE